MDDLTKLLSRFSLHAGVFYTGNICGIHDFPADAVRGHIHLIRRGPVFDEAFSDHSGRQAVLDRLCEVLMIRLLRHCIDQGLTQGGTLAGLADPRLAKALSAICKA